MIRVFIVMHSTLPSLQIVYVAALLSMASDCSHLAHFLAI